MTADDENVRPAPHTRDERTDRYAELIGRLYLTTSGGGVHTIEDIARAVVAVADAEREAEREQDAATIADLQARLRAVEALVDEMEAKPRPALMKGYSALTVVSLDRLRAALAPSTSPAEQERLTEHMLQGLRESGRGPVEWHCICRATGSAPNRPQAHASYERHLPAEQEGGRG